MIEPLIASVAYFVYVFFKAFQQRNVAFLHYRWILPISYAMSLTEVLVISLVAMKAVHGFSWDLVILGIAIGTGGGAGAITSMWLHNKYVGIKKPEPKTFVPLTKEQLRHREWVEGQLGD